MGSKISQEGWQNELTITGAELVPPRDPSKAPQVAIGLENPAGDYITDYRSLSDRALPYTVEALRTCGWKGDDVSDLSSCVGNKVSALLKNDTYNGVTKLKVAKIKPCRAGGMRKADIGEAKAIAAAYMSRIAALSIPSADPRPEPPPNDEMLPF